MLIQPMLQRLRAANGLEEMLQVALADVVALHGAERGNIQLFDTQQRLVLVRQSGLSSAFLLAFERVAIDHGAVCARAARQQKTVFVEDIETDAEFAPYRSIARSVPFRSVLSSPLSTGPDGCIGVISVHFANRFAPTALELHSLEAYCVELAKKLTQQCHGASLRSVAESLSARLLAQAA